MYTKTFTNCEFLGNFSSFNILNTDSTRINFCYPHFGVDKYDELNKLHNYVAAGVYMKIFYPWRMEGVGLDKRAKYRVNFFPLFFFLCRQQFIANFFFWRNDEYKRREEVEKSFLRDVDIRNFEKALKIPRPPDIFVSHLNGEKMNILTNTCNFQVRRFKNLRFFALKNVKLYSSVFVGIFWNATESCKKLLYSGILAFRWFFFVPPYEVFGVRVWPKASWCEYECHFVWNALSAILSIRLWINFYCSVTFERTLNGLLVVWVKFFDEIMDSPSLVVWFLFCNTVSKCLLCNMFGWKKSESN